MPLHRLDTEKSIADFVDAFMDDTVFTTGHFTRGEHPVIIEIVFQSYIAEHEAAGISLDNNCAAFEQRDRAVGTVVSPFTGRTYPVFETCNIVRDEEWQRVTDVLDLLLDPAMARAKS